MLDKHIEGYTENIEGLRDFVEVIEPFLLEKHDQIKTKSEKQLQTLIFAGLLKKIISHDQFSTISDELKEKTQNLKHEMDEELKDIFKGEVEISFEELGINEVSGGLTAKGLNIKSSKPLSDDILLDTNKTQNHINLLYQNSFLSLINSTEWFFAQILHFYFSRPHNASGIGKMNLTFDDLKLFSSVKDAEEFLIESKIEEILRNSFDKWIKTLKEELKLNLGYLTKIYDEIIEMYQRRNLIVHNGGKVNNIYLSKVSQVIKEGAVIGQQLEIDKKYLDNAINKLQLVFTLIAAELWKQLEPNNTDRADILDDIVYNNLLTQRWDIAEGISFFYKIRCKNGASR